MAGEMDVVLLSIVAFIFPPAAVAFIAGCGFDLCLNILLSLLGYFPGWIHAFWLIIKRADANEMYGYGNWTYVGMGKYRPRTLVPPNVRGWAQQVPPPPPPPPPGPYPVDQSAVSPPGQAPESQKDGYGYQPTAVHAEGKMGGNQAADQTGDRKYNGDQATAG